MFLAFCMSILLTAVAFLVLLTVLILLHECGHFFLAKLTGVHVEEFGFGLPPKVKTLFRYHGTIFSLNWVPFGGFVRLKGESAISERERSAPGSFSRASVPAKISILVAGVAMNFLLAFVLYASGFSFGRWVPTYLSFQEMQEAAGRGEISLELTVTIDGLLDGGPADLAGVEEGEKLLAVDGRKVTLPDDVPSLQEGKDSVTYTLQKDGSESDVVVKLLEGKAGVLLRSEILSVSAPPRDIVEGLNLALRETRVVIAQTVLGIGRLFISLARTGKVPEGITGIVGIAQLTHASVQEGLPTYLRLVALLSLSLAVLNILPLPALDGGRLLFVLVEVLRRRPANRRFELTMNTLGFSFLILLILLITFYDVLRLFE